MDFTGPTPGVLEVRVESDSGPGPDEVSDMVTVLRIERCRFSRGYLNKMWLAPGRAGFLHFTSAIQIFPLASTLLNTILSLPIDVPAAPGCHSPMDRTCGNLGPGRREP